jgi:lactoylglutathione lyase
MKLKMGVIAIEDYDRAKKFYTEKLEFEVITDANFDEHSRWIELKIPAGDAHVALFTPPGVAFVPTPCSNIIFSCEDVATKYQELKGRGVEFTQPPKQESWGISSLFKDSEGNIFCLASEG